MSCGETGEFGFEAVVDKTQRHDVHATILHLMGLDHELLTYFHQGRASRGQNFMEFAMGFFFIGS